MTDKMLSPYMLFYLERLEGSVFWFVHRVDLRFFFFFFF
jgi:hypothetical protein